VKIGFVSYFWAVGFVKLGSFRRNEAGGGGNWVRFAFFGRLGGRLGSFRIIAFRQIGGDADFEIPGLKRDVAVGWAWLVTPPVFPPLKVGVNYWMHAFGVRSI
jgi:hypothetical protein